MRSHDYWVYILTNRRCNALYIGITNNIARRLWQHRYGEVEGFAKRYHLNPACLGRALSQCQRRDRVREETEGLAPSQEDCPYRENEFTLARFQRRMGTNSDRSFMITRGRRKR